MNQKFLNKLIKISCLTLVVVLVLIITNVSTEKENCFFEKIESSEKIVYEVDGITAMSTEKEVVKKLKEFNNVNVVVNLDYEPFYLDKHTDDNSTLEENILLKQEKRALGKKYHTEKNEKYAKALNVKNCKNEYLSMYLPCIEYTYDREYFSSNQERILSKFCLTKDIDKVYVRGISEYKACLTEALEDSDAYDLVYDRDYTGDGIRVGVLDGGIVIEDHDSMDGVNLTIRDEFFFFESDSVHATMMASIIANQTEGIAPDCEIYSVEASGTLAGEFDWLVNQEVDIINMSIGDVNTNSTYDCDSAYADKLAYSYDIMMVAAAGNVEGSVRNVSNPAIGYNVLAVGSYAGSGDISTFTCTFEADDRPEKPNMIIRGSNIELSDFDSVYEGTSFSCAIASGFCAYLFEKYPSLMNNHVKAMAIMMGGCRQLDEYTEETTNGMNAASGAGLFDLPRAFYAASTLYAYYNSSTTNYTEDTVIVGFTRQFNIGDDITVAAFWNARNYNGDEDETTFTNYNIEFRSPMGELLGYMQSTNSNYDVITVKDAPMNGAYSLLIRQTGTKAANYNECIAVGFSKDVN